MKNILFLSMLLILQSVSAQKFDKCGTWRWNIKTLTDAQGADIVASTPKTTTINALNELNRPAKVSANSPRFPEEQGLVKVRGYIIEHKLVAGSDGDQDYHIVIQSEDGKTQLIAEIPSPECPEVFANPTMKELFTGLRETYDEYIGQPRNGKIQAVNPPVQVEVVGVPFWDMADHGGGHSANGIELHPLVGIQPINPIAAEVSNAVPFYKTAELGMSQPQGSTGNKTPLDYLILILLGGILGMAGQGIRVIVGFKKNNDKAATQEEAKANLDVQRMVFSLFIAFAVGGIAGVLAAVGSVDITIDKTTILAFLAAGYAGTDFIEGFMLNNKIK